MAFDLEVFNKQTHAVMTETIDQEVEKFNAASGGAIQLVSKPHRGDFDEKSEFKRLAGLVRRRNVYGTGAIAAKRLEQLKDVAVKIAAGTPPIEWEPAHYAWTQQNPELAALVIGEQLAKGQIADMLNAGLLAATAAIGGNADVKHTMTTAANFKGLVAGSAKFGDRSGAIKAWVMHSAVMHKLYENALTNVERLFSYDSVNVIKDPFGRVFVVTDSPALSKTTTGAKPTTTYNTLGLTDGGVVIGTNNDFNAVIENKTGNENIRAVYQAEWSFTAGVNGYAWDTTKGKSPDDTQIGTSANWLKIATSNKDTAGVLVVSK